MLSFFLKTNEKTMNRIKDGLLVTISAVLITILFYKQTLGLNLLIFELFVLIWLYLTKQFQFKGKNQITSAAGILVTAFFTVIHHSLLSYIVNFSVFFIFTGVVIAPEIRSIFNSILLSITNSGASQIKFVRQLFKERKKKGLFYYLKKGRIFLIPMIIILFFIMMYCISSPKFNDIICGFLDFIGDTFNFLFSNVELSIIFTFLLGLVISNFIFNRVVENSIINNELLKSDTLFRLKLNSMRGFKILALKNEYHSAIFLFAALNILILLLNIIDIRYVWFDFEWKGEYLKQFVHTGTYFLIFAILISIVLVLYFFRNNLNFLTKNKWLKYLCYIWLFQNVILVISVSIRNLYYINHFALAYKRIAIIFFLGLVIYGLYTVFIKVRDQKSKFYLLRTNTFSLLVVLIFSTFFNWDRIIAKYNFRNSDKSFVHLDFLSGLSDSSLPYLDKPMSMLSKLDIKQEERYSFKSSSGSFESYYMSPENYFNEINFRKKLFKKRWESKGWLSWNLAEAEAYELLSH